MATETFASDESEEELVGGGKIMSLFDHLSELRDRLIKSLLAMLFFFCLALAFSTDIFTYLKQPLLEVLPEGGKNLHFTGPLDVFLTSIKVSLLTGVIFSCPVWLYQFWRFLEPALYESERKYVRPFIAASILLFFVGVGFCFYLILPMALDFLIQLGTEVGVPIITVTDYTSMLTVMIFGFGIVFEAPLILILLGILDLVQAKTLSKYRRFVIVGILILAAILTPPDPLSQVGMAIPLYFMYELSILVIKVIQKRRS